MDISELKRVAVSAAAALLLSGTTQSALAWTCNSAKNVPDSAKPHAVPHTISWDPESESSKPQVLILRSARDQEFKMHGSHSSHASHASHASHYSGSGATSGGSLPPRSGSSDSTTTTPPNNRGSTTKAGSNSSDSTSDTPVAPKSQNSASSVDIRSIEPKTAAVLPESRDVLSLLDKADKYKTFLSIVMKAGMTDSLKKADALTVFAPSDAAFTRLPTNILTKIVRSDDPLELRMLIESHIIVGDLGILNNESKSLQMKNGEKVAVSKDNEIFKIGAVAVKSSNVLATNGLYHELDGVILGKIFLSKIFNESTPAKAEK